VAHLSNLSFAGAFRACDRTATSILFRGSIVAVILANAIVIGLSTYDGIERQAGELLDLLNEVFLWVFVVELLIRIAAHGSRPQDFFRNPWNVFDFLVISLAFFQPLRKSATLLRMARLMRIVRMASVLPAFRAMLVGMVRSAPAVAGMTLLILLVIYVYGMIGWAMFSESAPDHWGSIGASMLTLFTVLTLEGWNDVLYEGQEIRPGAWVYFVSYVMLVSFMLLNVMMAFLMSSIDRAREEDQISKAESAPVDARAQLEARLAVVNQALADLEAERAREGAQPAGSSIAPQVDERLVALHRALVDFEAELAAEARRHELVQKERVRVLTRGGRAL
jgi:voltage-gated sodium channel